MASSEVRSLSVLFVPRSRFERLIMAQTRYRVLLSRPAFANFRSLLDHALPGSNPLTTLSVLGCRLAGTRDQETIVVSIVLLPQQYAA